MIKRSSIPNIIVRLILEMSLMSIVCNFGGLLGMWLGFSVLSISKDIFNSFRRFYIFNINKINLTKNKITNVNLNVINNSCIHRTYNSNIFQVKVY